MSGVIMFYDECLGRAEYSCFTEEELLTPVHEETVEEMNASLADPKAHGWWFFA